MTQKSISRRQILTGAATASLGVVSLSACQNKSETETEPNWDHTADIVVVGSGLGACTAAVTALENGDSVLVVEKAPIFGGTSAKTVGVLWIPNNFTLREKGIHDKKQDCLEYLVRYSFPEHYDVNNPRLGISSGAYALLEAFYDNAYMATDMLRDTGALNLAEWRMFHLDRSATDYLDQVPENKVPNGRTLGTLAGDGKMGTGVDMMGQLETALTSRNVPILLEHRAMRLVMDDSDRAVGLEAEHAGQTISIRAHKAVIFGSGGYAHNSKMVANSQRNHIYGACAIPMATGDFINIAGAAGARMGNLSGAWRTQVVFEQTLKSSKLAGGVFFPAGDSMIQVNKYGQRVVNEKRNYNDRTEIHGVFDPSRAELKNQLLFMVYDQRTAEAFADIYPLPRDPLDSDYVIAGETLDQLADKISLRLHKHAASTGGVTLDESFKDNIENAVQRFNGFALSGLDGDFNRGEAAYDSEWHQAFSPMRTDTTWPENALPSVTMYPFSEQGPYYAIILAAGALDTNGGPEIDSNARVLNTAGEPIAGLYGTGNCIASPSRDAYWGAGCPLALSLTFGYVAANAAHKEGAVAADELV